MLGVARIHRVSSFRFHETFGPQASVAGMQKVLKHLKMHGSLEAVSAELASCEERQRLVGKPHYDALEKKYS